MIELREHIDLRIEFVYYKGEISLANSFFFVLKSGDLLYGYNPTLFIRATGLYMGSLASSKLFISYLLMINKIKYIL